MTELQAMPMFWAEFFADTEHLTEEAAKAHLFLLGHAWLRGARLPNDDGVLSRLCRISPRKWSAIKHSVLALWKREEDGFWSQKRMTKEFDFVRLRVEANRKNGSLGGRPKSLKTSMSSRSSNKDNAEFRNSERIDMSIENDNDFNESVKPKGFSGETQKNPPTLTPTTEERKSAPASAREPPSSLETECRRRVGQEPVLLAYDFHVITALLAENISEADILAGVDAAMADKNFRVKYWKQLVGWARRAGQDRLGSGAKRVGEPQARAGPQRNGYYTPPIPPERDVHAAIKRLSENIENGTVVLSEPPKPYVLVLAEQRERERQDSIRLLPKGGGG